MQSGKKIDPSAVIGPQKVKQAVTCPICLLVLTVPVYRCEQCQNHFCQKCLEDWWQTHRNQKSKCVYNCDKAQVKLMKRATHINTLLELLLFVCPNPGCQVKMEYVNIKEHDNNCEFKMIKCTNQECPESLQRKIFQQHEETCPYKIQNCPHCMVPFKRVDFEAHTHSCEEKKIPCKFDGCEQILKARTLAEHTDVCLFRPVGCKWCAAIVLNKQLKNHQQTCTLRQIQCNGCRKLFKMESYEEHFQNCGEVEVTCQLCDGRFNRKGLRNHPIQQCMVSTIKELKRENRKLWQQNIRLKINVEKIEEALENFESQKSKQISKSVVEQMRMQELSVIEKDLERINYSIASIEKLKKQEVAQHMKYPHLIESWCMFCKEIERKFAKMLEPLLEKKKQYESRRSEYQFYKQTRK